MNIFFLDKCPVKSANYMYRKHVNKMILETAQMLCAAHRVLDGYDKNVQLKNGRKKVVKKMICEKLDSVMYKATHINHPSTLWVMSSSEHYLWAYRHMIALWKKYGKSHLTIDKLKDILCNLPKNISNNGFTDPPQVVDEKYRSEDCVESYWQYYINEKSHVAYKDEEKYFNRPKQ